MEQALLNFDSPHLLDDEAAVLSMLREGRQAAVSSTIIEARTGLRPRRVQAIIRKLRLEGHNIGSATQDPMGYYKDTLVLTQHIPGRPIELGLKYLYKQLRLSGLARATLYLRYL